MRAVFAGCCAIDTTGRSASASITRWRVSIFSLWQLLNSLHQCCKLPTDRDAPVDHEQLAGHEAPGVGCEKHRDAADVLRITEPAQRRHAFTALAALFVFPQRAREIGFDKPR